LEAEKLTRISIVIPTFNRKPVLLRTLEALNSIDYASGFEVVVIDDGSSDGSADAAAALEVSYRLRVAKQQNSGAGAARNHGACLAEGEILLFLDDDMFADSQLLVEHARAQTEWDAVVGHIPVEPGSPPTALRRGLERWVRIRHDRLSGLNAPLELSDLLTGQLSVKATTFHRLGGFDESFNRGGTFGAEDTDFLYRLLQSGARATYLGTAISHQHYVVTPSQYLRQWEQAGRADAALVGKHQALRRQIIDGHGGRFAHLVMGSCSLAVVPDALLRRLSGRLAARHASGAPGRVSQWAFARVRDILYWRSFDAADGRHARAQLSVLAYHSIGDGKDLAPYGTTPEDLRDHLQAIEAVITLAEAIDHLEGAELSVPSVLLTFDDGYGSVHSHARGILRDAKLSAVAFVVSGQVGGVNAWDIRDGRAPLPLMTADELRDLQRDGWAIAAHTQTHTHLAQLTLASLEQELLGSLDFLTREGCDAPYVLAYPYGEHDLRVRRAVARAGYRYAFALGGGAVRPRRRDRLRIPRIEILGGMKGHDVVAAMMAPRPRGWSRLSREARGMLHLLLPRVGATPAQDAANRSNQPHNESREVK
jgi:glycosyltransferase involved in cell wall biosynthesis/peptidoglycan/xylan/chitin deacetylase (PgdA/CDA1 family)